MQGLHISMHRLCGRKIHMERGQKSIGKILSRSAREEALRTQRTEQLFSNVWLVVFAIRLSVRGSGEAPPQAAERGICVKQMYGHKISI